MAETLNIERASIGFRNFAGETGPYNRNGAREFAIFLDMDKANALADQGWNIKYPKLRDDIAPEDDDRNPYLPVTMAFDNFPPKVILISGETITRLHEDSVAMLDWAEIENVDIVINPYHWEMNGKTGIKAYVKAMYVTIVTDAFADKYDIY